LSTLHTAFNPHVLDVVLLLLLLLLLLLDGRQGLAHWPRSQASARGQSALDWQDGQQTAPLQYMLAGQSVCVWQATGSGLQPSAGSLASPWKP
jgi:hypothetical protein